jgi:glycyl-tRNA synthetase beta chain
MASELLVEIGCEEIPARFLPPALSQLEEKAASALENSKISHGEMKTFGTPRRMALAVYDVAENQEGWEDKRLGPPVNQAFDQNGAPTKAGEGFARSCGVSIEDLGREATPKGERLCYINKVQGKPAREVLAELIPGLIKSLVFPKAMRWGATDMAFVRPVHWVLAILGGDLIEFSLDGLASGRLTRGHRFTHPEEVEVSGIADYLETLSKRNVMPNPGFRRETIESDVEKKAMDLGGELYPDPGLMEEVTNLVECPVVISGGFDKRYLPLPADVLIAAMRTHQRYFAVRKPGTRKELLPCFITVANTPARDMAVVERGAERVLGARLADAEFYWDEDKKTGLEKMLERTAGMVFYKTLGSYMDKTGRVEKLCAIICEKLIQDDKALKDAALLAARYCKADLVSRMVGEFAELQGVMGGEYAIFAGMDEEVAKAIRDHYLPRSAEDISEGVYPRSAAGDAVSIADKLDSVVACWAAGLAPTGAGDPFALRRQAQGVINLVLAKGYRLGLPGVIHEAAGLSCPVVDADVDKVSSEVEDFILTRLRVQLIESGYSYDVVDACLAVWNGDLLDTFHKIQAVARMKEREDFDDLMTAFRRLMNIVEGEPGPVDNSLFSEESEAVLYSEHTRIHHQAAPELDGGDYDRALEIMAELRPSVDRFFGDVLVNVEDGEIRRNRHALCATIAGLFREIADFSRIVIQGDKTGQ